MRIRITKARIVVAAVLTISLLPVGWSADDRPGDASASASDLAPEEGGGEAAEERVTVTGSVMAAERGFFGQPTRLLVFTSSEGGVPIAVEGRGAELADHIGETVRIVAEWTLDDGGRRALRVEDWEPQG